MESLPLAPSTVLLLGIKQSDKQVMMPLVASMGFTVQQMELSEFFKNCISSLPALIIIDADKHGVQVISQINSVLTDRIPFEGQNFEKALPPLLVMMDATEPKKSIFEQGAKDYISTPLISEEFKQRISTAVTQTKQPRLLTGGLEFEPAYNRNRPLVDKVVAYLTEHLAEEVTLNQLAREVGSNRNTLSVEFKQHHQKTIFQWLREQRMERAKQLLRTTAKAVTLVAEQVGYPDSNNFATAFKRHFGISPAEYRKHQCNELLYPKTDNTYPDISVASVTV